MSSPKGRSFKKPKKISLGKEETNTLIQNCITKHELLDQSVETADLFPSEMLGNARINYDKHVNDLHQFCLLIQDWGNTILLSLAFSTKHFPSMDE